MDGEEYEQLKFQKAGIIKQIDGMGDAEMSFDQANEDMVTFVMENKVRDGLVSGNGSTWKEITFAPSAATALNGAPTENAKRNPAPNTLAQGDKCCVIA
mmetsp:Transcript_16394/g.24518  ORF Transcript_16394/g.24518 Transcript_16394/m.24518 type:complete len:99 (+) Transcript_16394:100-396(+)